MTTRPPSSRAPADDLWLGAPRRLVSADTIRVVAVAAAPRLRLLRGLIRAELPRAGKISSESIVDVEATVAAASVAACSQGDVELAVKKCFVVSKAVPDLPFQIVDASRNENDPKEGEVTVGLDTRLNHRVVDLRTPANQAIMRIRAAVPLLFASYLDSQNFVGVNSPKLLAGSSEGGSSVFKLSYFGRDCCLAQSPQLYKQMALMADLERVFEVAPVFRSENSLTHRHMCEFVGLDMEMCFHEHYSEVLDMMDRTFNAVFDGLNSEYASEQAATRP